MSQLQLFDVISSYATSGEKNPLHKSFTAVTLKGHGLEAYNEHQRNLRLIKRKRLPINIVCSAFAVVALILICALALLLEFNTVKEIWTDYRFLVYATLLSIVVLCVVIAITAKINIGINTIQAKYEQTEGARLLTTAHNSLNISGTLEPIFLFQRKFRTKPRATNIPFLVSIDCYKEGNSVCFFDEGRIIKIPVSDCVSATVVNEKKIYMPKVPVDYKSPEIAPCKIKDGSNGQKVTPSYGVLQFVTKGEAWSIEVPPFSTEKLAKIFEKEIK